MAKVNYYCDNQRHLVCVPYTIDKLHNMVLALNIKKCWFHKNHYDIPRRRIAEITKYCIILSPREILKITKS